MGEKAVSMNLSNAGYYSTFCNAWPRKTACLNTLVFDGADITSREPGVLVSFPDTSMTARAWLFSSCQVISNHLANNPQTVGMLDYCLFHRMGKTAAFVNTGRGAQVVEADLARAMEEEPLRSAVLDVTIDEPYPLDGVLRKLENVCILPHIAGFAQQDVLRFSDWVIRQLDRYQAGLPVENVVTEKQLETMA